MWTYVNSAGISGKSSPQSRDGLGPLQRYIKNVRRDFLQGNVKMPKICSELCTWAPCLPVKTGIILKHLLTFWVSSSSGQARWNKIPTKDIQWILDGQTGAFSRLVIQFATLVKTAQRQIQDRSLSTPAMSYSTKLIYSWTSSWPKYCFLTSNSTQSQWAKNKRKKKKPINCHMCHANRTWQNKKNGGRAHTFLAYSKLTS